MNNLDLTTIFGIIAAILIVCFGIFLSGANLNIFFHPPSLVIVVVGTFFITLACFSVYDVMMSHITIFSMITFRPEDSRSIAKTLIEVAVSAYKNGLLSLENNSEITSISSNMFNKGLEYVADGTTPKLIENIVTQEINTMIDKNYTMISILKKAAEVAPAMGLIGTLIGLIQMLDSLNDISKIGPAMSVALLTTFYGAILAYMIFFPLASKFEKHTSEEILNNKLYAKALISIAKHENPRQLEIHFNSILPEDKRIVYFSN